MQMNGLSIDDFFQTVFVQDADRIFSNHVTSRKNDYGDRFLEFDFESGIIWAYGIHVLGVLRIFQNVKYLFVPYGTDSIEMFKQSRTTNRYDSDMRYRARQNNWNIRYFFPKIGQGYEAGIQNPVYFDALKMKSDMRDNINNFTFDHNYQNANDLYNAVTNMQRDFANKFEDLVLVTGEIKPSLKTGNKTNMRIKIQMTTNENSLLSKSLNMKYNKGIAIDYKSIARHVIEVYCT